MTSRPTWRWTTGLAKTLSRWRRRATRMLRQWWSPRLGVRGERLAERFLLRQGYVIVGRNVSDRLGELDLVAVDGRTVVFVEVKTQSDVGFKRPQDDVDRIKRRRVIAASRRYIRRHGLAGCQVRYDIIAIVWRPGQPPEIEHLRNAFRDERREAFQVG